jgi:hypothetical protein
MDIESYRNIIKSLLTAYAAVPIANGTIDSYTVFDTEQDHYLVRDVWDGFDFIPIEKSMNRLR